MILCCMPLYSSPFSHRVAFATLFHPWFLFLTRFRRSCPGVLFVSDCLLAQYMGAYFKNSLLGVFHCFFFFFFSPFLFFSRSKKAFAASSPYMALRLFLSVCGRLSSGQVFGPFLAVRFANLRSCFNWFDLSRSPVVVFFFCTFRIGVVCDRRFYSRTLSSGFSNAPPFSSSFRVLSDWILLPRIQSVAVWVLCCCR